MIFLADFISIVRTQLSPKLNEEISNEELADLYHFEVAPEAIITWLVYESAKH